MPVFVMARERFNFTELRSNYTLKFSNNLLVLDHFSSQSSKIAIAVYCPNFWGWSSVAETTIQLPIDFLAATQVSFPLNNKFSFLCFKYIFIHIITTSLLQLRCEYISFKIFHFYFVDVSVDSGNKWSYSIQYTEQRNSKFNIFIEVI